MNRSSAVFMALIIMTTSVAGCLGESKERIDEIPIGTWFDDEGNTYSFFSNGIGEITYLNESYWEIPRSNALDFEVDEFAWERTNNSVSILTNDFFLDEQLILHEDEEYFKLSGSCKKFVYKSDYIRTKENLSARWSEFNAIESAYYNENPNVDGCYDSWLREQVPDGLKKIMVKSIIVESDNSLYLTFELAPGSSWTLDEMITWQISCQREDSSYSDSGNFTGIVLLVGDNSQTKIINTGTSYSASIVLQNCVPASNHDDELLIQAVGLTYELLNYGSDVSPGVVIV